MTRKPLLRYLNHNPPSLNKLTQFSITCISHVNLDILKEPIENSWKEEGPQKTWRVIGQTFRLPHSKQDSW